MLFINEQKESGICFTECDVDLAGVGMIQRQSQFPFRMNLRDVPAVAATQRDHHSLRERVYDLNLMD